MSWTVFLAGLAIVVSVIFFILKQFFGWKGKTETRIRLLENANANKTAKIELLEKLVIGPFEKGEK